MITTTEPDVLDAVLAIEHGDRLDRIRRARPATRENAQLSYSTIFDPEDAGSFAPVERFAVAVVVTVSCGEERLAEHYAERFAQIESRPQMLDALRAVGAEATTAGPFGHFREQGLHPRNTDGLRYRVDATRKAMFGEELTALIEHAHLLTFRPREASPASLEELVEAGWTTREIVALSQLVAFLSFQARVAAGLRVLRASWDADR